jgi:hypothetical protein
MTGKHMLTLTPNLFIHPKNRRHMIRQRRNIAHTRFTGGNEELREEVQKHLICSNPAETGQKKLILIMEGIETAFNGFEKQFTTGKPLKYLQVTLNYHGIGMSRQTRREPQEKQKISQAAHDTAILIIIEGKLVAFLGF